MEQENGIPSYNSLTPDEPYGSDVLSAMNTRGIINIFCHGYPERFACMTSGNNQSSISYVTTENYSIVGTNNGYFSNLNNNFSPSIIYSISCHTAAYDALAHTEYSIPTNRRSMVEGFLCFEDKGGCAYIGQTRENSAGYNGSTNVMDEFYEYIFGTDKIIGNAFVSAINGSLHQQVITNNLFADPTMKVWTNPGTMSTPSITDYGSYIIVSNVTADAHVSVSSTDFSYSSGETTGAQSYQFTTATRPLYVVVTQENMQSQVVMTGGTITSNQVWPLDEFEYLDKIVVYGDLTIASSRTLSLGENFNMCVAPGKDIEVYGTLSLGVGSAITKKAGSGDWGDLTIYAGGTLNTNTTDYTISDFDDITIAGTANFLNGITLNSDESMTVSGTLGLGTGSSISINGLLRTNTGALITKAAGQNNWDRININNGGELWIAGSSTIEYSDYWTINILNGGVLDIDDYLYVQDSLCGITLDSGGDFQKLDDKCLTIRRVVTGFRVYYNTDTIKNVYFENCTRGLYIQGTSNPVLQNLTVYNPETYGMIVSTNADATLAYSVIHSSTTDTWPYNLWLYSGADIQLYMGENDFYPGDGYAIYTDPNADDVYAGGNYWGDDYPVWNSIFNYYQTIVTVGYYYFTPRDHGVYKPLLAPAEETVSPVLAQLKEAIGYERAERWDSANIVYREILASTDNPSFRRKALKAMLRVADQGTKDYSELRQLVQNERITCLARYESLYDMLLCELHAREGDYREAVDAYEYLKSTYDDTEAGVEILTRLAKLYADELGDSTTARAYAEQAASINPGQLSLEIAYDAVGIKYDPYAHDDVFSNRKARISDEPQEPEKESDAVIEEFIINSPNPFNPATVFNFAIAEAGHVTLDVYSITGQKVATLVDNTLSAGTHNAVFDGNGFGSGMYFYRFQSSGLSKTGKMLLVK